MRHSAVPDAIACGTRERGIQRDRERRFSPACAGNATVAGHACGCSAVQPRVCGERAHKSPSVPRSVGSAPRVRGTLGAIRATSRRPVQPRVCGERVASSSCAGLPTVQPRVCGERAHGVSTRRLLAVQPRVCGERVAVPPHETSRVPVQPRVCGERMRRDRLMQLSSGSAPRVRGTHELGSSATLAARFSPACAGNAWRTVLATMIADRFSPACAGNAAVMRLRCQPVTGSAPRVRGTRGQQPRAMRSLRFSPACAGNACRRALLASAWSVQPRVCGERALSMPRCRASARFSPACAGNASCGHRASPPSAGSAPRVRGTLRPTACGAPMHAGSAPRVRGTHHRPAMHAGATVQPRVCGERTCADASTCVDRGSAPRVRGTLAALGDPAAR